MLKKTNNYCVKQNNEYLVGAQTQVVYWSDKKYLAPHTQYRIVAEGWAKLHGGRVEEY